MKKLITFLFSFLVSSIVIAQTKEGTANFNFLDGSSLNPQLYFDGTSPSINVENIVFTDGPVSLSFNSKQVDAQYYNSVTGPELRVYRGGTLIVSAASGAELLQIKFIGSTSTMSLSSTQGTLDSTTDTWKNIDSNGQEIDDVKSASFFWGSNPESQIKQILVTYRSPQNTLVASSINPAKGAIVNSFKDLIVTFNMNMGNVNDVTLKKGISTVGTLKQTSVNGNTVTLSLDEEISEPGNYSVTFPRASCTSADEFFNSEFSTSFTIEEPRNTFNPISVPDEKVDEAMPNVTEIEFPGNIGNRNALALHKFDVIGKENGKVATADVSFKGFKTMVFTLSDDVNVPDVYTITVPAKTVFDADNVKYNDEFVITYRVAGADAPSDEVLAKAAALLENTGIGYPTEDSEARTKLSEMVRLHNQGDDAFNEAISEFLSTSDVELPAAGEYYSLANVAKNGTKWYIAYSKGAASLTKDASKAYSFLTGDGLTFKTLDGKYLVVLGTTSTNVSDNAKKLNVKKMTVQGEEEATFGMLTIDNGTYYSTVKTDGSVRDEEDVVKFNDTYSAAFKFSPADAPKEEPTETNIQISVNPISAEGYIEALDNITVSFIDVQNVSYDESFKVYLLSSSNQKIYALNVQANAAKNEYTFLFPSLINDTYKFVSPEGAFKYKQNGKTVFTQEVEKSFTVFYEDAFMRDFNNINEMWYTPEFSDNGVPASQLNNISFWFKSGLDYVEPFIDNSKDVAIYDSHEGIAAKGKFVKRSEVVAETYLGFFRNGTYIGEVAELNENKDAVLLVTREIYTLQSGDEIKELTRTRNAYYLDLRLEREMNAEDDPDGKYLVAVKAASFGDQNFAKYLNNPSSIAMHDCHVNGGILISCIVKNNATGIENVDMKSLKHNTIFDLSGRRVENMSTPGIYIINGKKFIKK